MQVTLKVTKSSVQLYESLGDNKLQLNNNKTEMILTAQKKFLSSLFLSPSKWVVMTSNFPTQLATLMSLLIQISLLNSKSPLSVLYMVSGALLISAVCHYLLEVTKKTVVCIRSSKIRLQ